MGLQSGVCKDQRDQLLTVVMNRRASLCCSRSPISDQGICIAYRPLLEHPTERNIVPATDYEYTAVDRERINIDLD